jgi:hypothetical protein
MSIRGLVTLAGATAIAQEHCKMIPGIDQELENVLKRGLYI